MPWPQAWPSPYVLLIRIADTAEALGAALDQASAEAKAAFGDGGLYLEKFIAHARHIEVQVLGDGRDAIHCYRARMLAAAPPPENLGGGAGRRRFRPRCARRSAPRPSRWPGRRTIAAPERSNISTTSDTPSFYFIEMNTRIQVEHPVTEMITGIDLVREMLRIAGGEPLRYGNPTCA